MDDPLTTPNSEAELINARVPWDDNIKDVSVDFPEQIARLLLCNSPPTEEQLPLVTGYLHDAIEALVDLQVNVRSLQREIEELAPDTDEHRRSQQPPSALSLLTKQIDAARIILAPIRRVPPEILQEVALICSSDPPNLDAPLAARFPMRLCRVSSEWRRSIQSYARLWTHIHCNPATGSNSRFFESTIQKYTRLASTAPIHLDLVLTPMRQHSRYKTDRFVSRTIYLMTTWAGRSQMAYFSIDFGASGVESFVKIVAGQRRFGSFPNLREVTFHAPHQSSSVTVFKQLFANAPGVTNLYLETHHSFLNFDVLPQSMMSSLLHVNMKGENLSAEQWLLVMVGCSKLQTASFDLDGHHPQFEQAIRVIEAREMATQTLNFRTSCLYNPYLPFRWISFPRLTTLNIRLSSPYPYRIRMLQDRYQPKLPNLRHLSIDANVSRGLWGIEDEADRNAHINNSTEDIEETIRRFLSLSRRNLLTLNLSLSAPLRIWRNVFSIWSDMFSGIDTKELPAIKSLHLGMPAQVVLQDGGEALVKFLVKQVHHPICKLEHLNMTIGVEKYDGMEQAIQAKDILRKELKVHVGSNELSWEAYFSTDLL